MKLHPALYSCTTESNVRFASPGKICPRFPAGGRNGQSKSHSSDDFIVPPLGMMTLSGSKDNRLLCTFAWSAS